MPTLSDLLAASAERLLVGRGAEQKRFLEWFGAPEQPRPILNIYGPGGFGKTTLLRAFARSAATDGRPVLSADARDAAPSPGGLLQQLGAARPADVAAALGDGPGLLLLDTFEEMEALTPFLQSELLPALSQSTRVVIAGRGELTRGWDEWRGLIAPMNLKGLKQPDVREYLSRRGITDPAAVKSIVSACGGHPLALALAADLHEQFGVHDFAATGEWQLTIRRLADELLRDARDPKLVALLEAASVVYRFDEGMLEAISGETETADAFARLCSLAVVRPTPQGLALHDEVRHLLSKDLRWRRPDRYRELRERAFQHLTALLGKAEPADRTRLTAERIALVDDPAMHQFFFRDEPERVWVDDSRPSRDELHRVLAAFREMLPQLTVVPPPEELRPEFVDALLDYPATTFSVARDAAGKALAYGFVLPICEESVALLPPGEVLAGVVEAWMQGIGGGLPRQPGAGAARFMSTIALTPEQPAECLAALGRWVVPLMASSHRVIAATGQPEYIAQLELMGFREVDGSERQLPDGRAVRGYQMDISLIGGEAWAQALVSGRPIPVLPGGQALEDAIDGALTHWEEDGYLAASPLAELARFRYGDGEESPVEAVRSMLRSTLESARGGRDREREQALRALELSTIEKSTATERAAERLNMSRATFYRQRRRGLQLVREALEAGAGPEDLAERTA